MKSDKAYIIVTLLLTVLIWFASGLISNVLLADHIIASKLITFASRLIIGLLFLLLSKKLNGVKMKKASKIIGYCIIIATVIGLVIMLFVGNM